MGHKGLDSQKEVRLKILATILVCDLILGAVMALYIAVTWKKNQDAIAKHGWNLEQANPICNYMWLYYFIPVVGIMCYLVAGETMGKLAVTRKEDVNGIVSVYYGKLGFHYDEDHKM